MEKDEEKSYDSSDYHGSGCLICKGMTVMSHATKEINKITGTIIGVSGKLIVYALVILLLYEGISSGFQFGYEVFHPAPMAAAPGVDMQVTIDEGESVSEISAALKASGLIGNEYVFLIQCRFYEYGSGEHEVLPGAYVLNNSMTSKEIIVSLRDGPPKEEETTQ